MNPEPRSLTATQIRLTSILASALYSRLDRKRIAELYEKGDRDAIDGIFLVICGRSLDVLLKFSELPDVVDSSHELPDINWEDC